MSQAEGLDVVWRPEMAHSDLLITVSCDDVLVIQCHCLKDGTRASLTDILIKKYTDDYPTADFSAVCCQTAATKGKSNR